MISPMIRKTNSILLGMLLSLFLAGNAVAEKTKVGFIYVGPVSDHGWTYQHDQGRLAVEAAMGDDVETTFVESVPEGQDSERVIRRLAISNHKMIFTTSFGYMNPTNKVAAQFKDVKFEHATGYKRSDNVSTYNARFYEGRYIIGRIAGAMSKSGVVGYVASFPIPEVVRGINAFTLGLRSVNPQATVKVVWVNTWFDSGKEADAAKAMIDQGADIITQHTTSPAPLQVAEERGVYAFGQASDMKAYAPKAQLTAIINDWAPYYVARVKAVIDGSWAEQDTWGGLAAGMVKMAPYNKDVMPAAVVADAMATEAAIIDGSLHPFAGPITDQSGKEVVADGVVIDNKTLHGMNWYVEGIDDTLPN